ncbi:MAG: ribonuclease HII [Candidatus Pacebacteria bacterium]|nr:ribonuclease HII [Candidatus Paceibacterota bacterium]
MFHLREEKKLWKKKINTVVGLDEAGRGPLAGPVLAAAVFVSQKTIGFPEKQVSAIIRDSKQLSPQKREEIFKMLEKCPAIKWGIGIVSEKTIDRINIFEASKLAMLKALKDLEKKLLRKADFLILDGNFKINVDGRRRRKLLQKSIIKADEKVFSCMAAGIIAKVSRDKIMKRIHKKFSKYGFDQHKGYPTELHRLMIKKWGPCKVHRKSFCL